MSTELYFWCAGAARPIARTADRPMSPGRCGTGGNGRNARSDHTDIPVLPEMSLFPERAAHFRKDRDMTRFVPAEAISDWKSEASNQRVESEARSWRRNGAGTGPGPPGDATAGPIPATAWPPTRWSGTGRWRRTRWRRPDARWPMPGSRGRRLPVRRACRRWGSAWTSFGMRTV